MKGRYQQHYQINMGKKPKAPDMSWQIEAAKQQELRLAQQQREADMKSEQTAMLNTEKLRATRRRAMGGSILDPTRVAAPPSELSDIEKQKAKAQARENMLQTLRGALSKSKAELYSHLRQG